MITESYTQTFGVKAGLNFANVTQKDNSYVWDNSMLTGFHFGLTAEFPIDEMFSFETGLSVSSKGAKSTEESPYYGEGLINYKSTLTYIDIPLTLKAKYDMNGTQLYGVLGPYIGISGTNYTDGEGEKVKWGSDEDNDELKPLDFGLTIGAGVELDMIQIGITYNLGLANISSDTRGGYKISNNVFALSVGYKFGGK